MQVPTVILADLHLTLGTPRSVTRDLAAVVARHPGQRVLFAGDLFDLSAERPRTPRSRAVREVLEAHPEARAALAAHVDRGGELWMIAGNHDAHLADPDVEAAIRDTLDVRGAPAAQRVRFSPWFFRIGDAHVEHGHLYDPDNTPCHPLVLGQRSLGVHFVEEFISTTGAHAYLHRNDETPLKLLVAAFRWYGVRAPYVVYRYFATALSAMAQSGPLRRDDDERRQGEDQEAAFAAAAGVDARVVAALRAAAAVPTQHSLGATFHRIYFDRVLSTLAVLGGAGALLGGARRTGLGGVLLGASTLGLSWKRRYDRYGGTVAQLLEKRAADVADLAGAALVVFGHTHRELLSPRYANTGSFSFPTHDRGRPYLRLEVNGETPRLSRCYGPRSRTDSRAP